MILLIASFDFQRLWKEDLSHSYLVIARGYDLVTWLEETGELFEDALLDFGVSEFRSFLESLEEKVVHWKTIYQVMNI
jgi:hypothetical protein